MFTLAWTRLGGKETGVVRGAHVVVGVDVAVGFQGKGGQANFFPEVSLTPFSLYPGVNPLAAGVAGCGGGGSPEHIAEHSHPCSEQASVKQQPEYRG